MGLEFDHPQGAKFVMKHLYENGVWAIFSTLDPRVLQFKPGILLDPELVEELLDRTEVAIARPGRRGRGCAAAGDRGRRSRSSELPRRGRPACRGPGMMLQRAHWAGHGVRRLRPRAHPCAIVEAVAEAGVPERREVRRMGGAETGFGVVEHKLLKNEACSHGAGRALRAATTTSAPRIDADGQDRRGAAAGRRGARADPVDQPGRHACYFKVLLALMTRNAVVVSPHPLAKEVLRRRRPRASAAAAVEAGAPDGVHPGGRGADDPADRGADDRPSAPTSSSPPAASPVVRAAYRSGNPAIGVGPGNVPVLVDAHRRPGQGGPADRGLARASTTRSCAPTSRC